jgi:plasmid maintenance system antidote protein VapI
MMMGVYDAAAICKAIAVDFKVKGLTHETAASQLGCSKQTVSNQISGKKKFSLKTAQRYDETFGYNLEFLLFGKGELNETQPLNSVVDVEQKTSEVEPTVAELKKQVRLARRLFRIMNNPDAIAAYEAVMSGDDKTYVSLFKKLHYDFGWQVSIGAVDSDFMDRLRRLLAEVQERRAIILAERLDREFARDGVVSVQALLEDCKEDILSFQKEHPTMVVGELD